MSDRLNLSDISQLERNALATYAGGYSSPAELSAFQHGMQTAFNVFWVKDIRHIPPGDFDA